MQNTHAMNYPIRRPGVPPISGKVCDFFFFFANVEHPMYPGMCMLDAVGKRPQDVWKLSKKEKRLQFRDKFARHGSFSLKFPGA
jgi:hypothetical protein